MSTQNRAFWAMYISFSTTATLLLYMQGIFFGLGLVAKLILVLVYLLAGVLIRVYVKSNADEIRKWFDDEKLNIGAPARIIVFDST